MKGYRKIAVDGIDYEYKVGRNYVDIRPPEGRRMTPDFEQVTGLTWDQIEWGTWKGFFSVTPQHIKEYIERRQYAEV